MRLIFACIGGWFVLAFATTLASADPVTIRVDRPSALPAAGEPYLMNVIVAKCGRHVSGKPPVVEIRHGRETRVFHAVRTGRPGIYRVRVVLPTAADGTSRSRTRGESVVTR